MSLSKKDEKYLEKLRTRHAKDGFRMDILQDHHRISDHPHEWYDREINLLKGFRSGEGVKLFVHPPTDEVELDDLRVWYRTWDPIRVRLLTSVRKFEKYYGVDRSVEGKRRL